MDEADLMALMEDGQSAEKPPVVCNCTENAKPVRSPNAGVQYGHDRLYRQGSGAKRLQKLAEPEKKNQQD